MENGVSLLEDFGVKILRPTIINCDNMAAALVASNPHRKAKSKTVQIKTCWVQERVEKGEIKVVHVRTDVMRADMLTKQQPVKAHIENVKRLGLRSISKMSGSYEYLLEGIYA